MKNQKMLIGVALVGVLILSVVGTGCIFPNPPTPDLRIKTTVTAIWIGSKPTSAPVTSGGLQVSGKLTDINGKALGNLEVWLGGAYLDGSTNLKVKSALTNTLGEYKLTLASSEDIYAVYGTYFEGIGDLSNVAGYSHSGYNVIVGYNGLVKSNQDAKAYIQSTPSSSWVAGTKTAFLTVMNAYELQVKYGRYSDAANTIQTKILPKVTNVSPTPPNTRNWIYDATLQKEVYNSAVDAINSCRLLSGQITESTTSGAGTVYTPALMPQI